ncbi:lectin-like domain-containing protein [Neptunitalea lumnitzerae]|uniref:PKD domain-containing protein n=1 Tax=Neptunitalea lumnitzerae TaxID=2965509 RepID=A0ABQ5MKU2_9FLAO|nr:T9SS type B sorting domain-containing protein [Neptunitalea sp. Y10]GLB49972.1 hypothetical protein Y10_23400 [Neptunitalea sp. Y10]
MLKKYIFLIFLTVSVNIVKSQKEAANWYFGNYAGIAFDPCDSLQFDHVLYDGALSTTEGCASISKKSDGSLLFYTDGTYVYNRNHTQMPNGSGLIGDPSSTQSGIIVPFTDDDQKFYIFTVDDGSGPLAYSVVDMSLDSGFGDVVASQKNILLLNSTSEKICATESDNDGYWVIAYGNSSPPYTTMAAFEITAAGVQPPVISNLALNQNSDSRGYLKISPDGTKIACASASADELYLYNFDPATGAVYDETHLGIFTSNDTPYGLEFSTNSNILYCHSYNGSSSSNLIQYDLTADDIELSQITLHEGNNVFRGALQLGIDGRIYRTVPLSYTTGTNYLSVIEHPNVYGPGCGYTHNAIDLGTGIATQGLPPFISSFLHTNIEEEYICETDTTEIELLYEFNEANGYIEWDFGDPDSPDNIYVGPNGGLTATHVFTHPGTFEVIATIHDGCIEKNVKNEITIYELPDQEVDLIEWIACTSNLDGSYEFDFTEKDAEILGNTPIDFTVNYYFTQTDAENETNPITGPYTYTSNTPEMIYAVIVNPDHPECRKIDAFEIGTELQPVVNQMEGFALCDEGLTYMEIDLTPKIAEALGTQDNTLFNVSFHSSLYNAEDDLYPLSLNYNAVTTTHTIYVRVENVNHEDCYEIGTFEILFYDSPTATPVDDIYGCLDETTGLATFDTDGITEAILNGASHSVLFFDANGNSLGNELPDPLDIAPQTITAQVTDSYPVCYNFDGSNFTLNGDAYYTTATNDTIELTHYESLPDADGNMGSAWANSMFDITEDFNIDAQLYFGLYNAGADGIAFVLQPLTASAGTIGGGLGYEGIAPSLAVEFDTFNNADDPLVNDHIAIISDGNASNLPAHSEYTTPYDAGNIEDGQWHSVNFNWDADTMTYTITYEGTVVQTATIDMLNDVFAGNPYVYWGFTAATGAATNTQMVLVENFCGAQQDVGCSDSITFDLIGVTPLDLTPITPLETCDTDDDGFAEFDTSTIQDLVESDFSDIGRYTVEYYDVAGNLLSTPLPNPYVNSTIDTETLTISVTDTLSGCTMTNDLTLIVNPRPQVITPTPLYGCNYDGTGYTTFTLSDKTAEILNGQTGMNVYYYASMADLEANTAALPNQYVNTATPSQTIFVKLQDGTTGCYNTTTLELIIAEPPVANTPSTITFCDDDNDGFGEFYFDYVYDEVIPDGTTNYTVTIHETEEDAEYDQNPQVAPYENIYADNQTMYVRVENDLTECYDIVELELIVNPTPVVPYNLEPLEICDDQLADGRAEFDLTEQNANVFGTQSTTDYTITYHLTYDYAVLGTPALSTYYTNYIPYSQEIYVRLEDNVTGCFTVREFDLIVNPNPVINPSYDNDLALCDDFGQPGDEITEFDLTVENEEITGGINGYIVSYYETEADADAGINPVPDDTSYFNTVSPYTMHVRVEDANTGCYTLTTVTLRVLNNPSPLADNQDLEVCDDDSDGDSTNGQAEFDLTTYESELLNGETNVTPTYYETYDDAFDGTNPIPNPEAYYNVDPFAQTIYVAVTNNSTGCLTITTIDIIVHPLPEVTDEPTYFLCEVDNDDVETILLTEMDGFVLDNGDATDLTITYYETETNAIDDEAEYVGPYITINSTEQIYARVENTVTGCISVIGFLIDIEQAPLAFTPDPIVYCESLGADGYYNNDGVEVFNLEEVIETIRGSQDPDTYPVAIYTSLADAEAGINAIPTDELNPYTSGTTTLYAVVTNVNTTCTNGDPIVIELIVEPVPEVTLDNADGIICTDATNNPIIGTDLGAEYTYEWNTGETTPTIEITEAGEYYVTITNTTTINQCAYESNHVYYEEASLPAVTPTVVQSEIFDGQNTVQVTANGAGVSEYGYQLDHGSMQYSGTFNNVEPGIHTVTITELNGCGSLTLEVSVIDYMKYFTPNGDGVNDTWRVIGLESQENAQVFIFDRQGKLVKQMSATSDGWNGTYNGNQMPSSDYWFKVVYTEPSSGEVREFNSHFSLKR